MSLRSATAIVHPVNHLIWMGDSLVLLPRSSLQSARASKKKIRFFLESFRTPSDSFISKNEGMAKVRHHRLTSGVVRVFPSAALPILLFCTDLPGRRLWFAL